MNIPEPEAYPPLQGSPFLTIGGWRLDLEKVVWGFLLALAAFHLLTTERVERPGYDSSIYILGARSLAWHGAYEMDGIRITTHPPGLPLLLAVPIRFFGCSSHEFLVRFMPLFGVAGLLIWLQVLGKAAGFRPAAAAVVLAAVSPVYYHVATRYVMADLLYFMLSGAAVLACFQMASAGTRLAAWGWGACSVIAVMLSVLTRSAGVALAASLLAWALWPGMPHAAGRPRLRTRMWCAIAGLAGLLVFTGWIAWGKAMENREEMGGHMASYSSQFLLKNPLQPDLGPASPADMLARAAKAAPLRAAQAAEILTGLPWVSPAWHNPLVLGLLVLPLAAIGRAAGDPLLLLAWLYFAAFEGLFCLWPFAETARFMLPIAPVCFLFAWIGASQIPMALLRVRPGWIAAALVAVGAAALWWASRSSTPLGLQDRMSLTFWPAAAAVWIGYWTSPPFLKQAPAMLAARRMIAPVVIALLIAGGLAGQARLAQANLHPRPGQHVNAHLRAVSAWLNQAPAGAVMCSSFPYVHRMTGRKCVAFPVTADPRRIHEAIVRYKVRYLVVAGRLGEESYFRPSEPERAASLSAALPSLLRLVQAGREWSIYEISLESYGAGGGRPAD